MNSSVYLYRQHSGGEWGGIKNFSSEVMTRRAKWNLTLVPVLLENKALLGIVSEDMLSNVVNYYKVLLSNKKLSKILCAKTTNYYKLKLFPHLCVTPNIFTKHVLLSSFLLLL